MNPTLRGTIVALAASVATFAALAQDAPIDAAPLPFGTERVPASADECAVWRRERAFALSVEAHDAAGFAGFLHPGTVFSAGTPEADRGSGAVAKSWAEIVAGRALALRWRPGIVQIGGEPHIALSKGPFILQTMKASVPTYRVGLYQTVWVRENAAAAWRVLFDSIASTPLPMADRAAADAWVAAQAMSDCAAP